MAIVFLAFPTPYGRSRLHSCRPFCLQPAALTNQVVHFDEDKKKELGESLTRAADQWRQHQQDAEEIQQRQLAEARKEDTRPRMSDDMIAFMQAYPVVAQGLEEFSSGKDEETSHLLAVSCQSHGRRLGVHPRPVS